MKKLIVMFSTIFIFLSGCSFLEEAKGLITYIGDASDFLDQATDFANEAQPLAQKAVDSVQSTEDLEAMLQSMKQKIIDFNDVQAPELAAELHDQLVNKNQVILNGINRYLENIVDGRLDPTILENTELFQTVHDISSIIDQIQQLGE